MQSVHAELLGSYRMAPAGHRHATPLSHRTSNHLRDVLGRPNHDHLLDRGRLKSRMYIVGKETGRNRSPVEHKLYGVTAVAPANVKKCLRVINVGPQPLYR